MLYKRMTDFKILKLLIATTVIGISAAVAIPSYQSNLQSSRRTDTITALLYIQAQQSQSQANNVKYAANLTANLG